MTCPKCGAHEEDRDVLVCRMCGEMLVDDDAVNEEVSETAVNEEVPVVNEEEVLKEVSADETEPEGENAEVPVEPEPEKVKYKLDIVSVITSFLAGVLCTLLVVGCVNGTFSSLYKKVIYGSPKKVVTEYCEAFLNKDGEAMLATFTDAAADSYISNYIAPYSAYYGLETSADMNDAEYVSEWLEIVYGSTIFRFDSISDFECEYIKRGTNEFESLLADYEGDVDEVKMAATVSFIMNYSAADVVSDTMETPDDTAFRSVSLEMYSVKVVKIGNSWYLSEYTFKY